jgi:branched-chain amino acid transport system substrate-binding protein
MMPPQYGKGLIDEFEKAAKAKDAHIVLHEATNNKATDFKAILTNIRAKNPDVIVYGGMALQRADYLQSKQKS